SMAIAPRAATLMLRAAALRLSASRTLGASCSRTITLSTRRVSESRPWFPRPFTRHLEETTTARTLAATRRRRDQLHVRTVRTRLRGQRAVERLQPRRTLGGPRLDAAELGQDLPTSYL